LATWDPFTFAILTEVAGHVKYQDLKEGVTFDEEVDEVTGQSRHGCERLARREETAASGNSQRQQQGVEDLPDAGARKSDGG